MGSDDDTHASDVEFLDVGRERGSGRSGRAVHRWPRWLPVLLAAVVAAIAVTLIVHGNSTTSASPTKRPPLTARSTPSTSSTPSSSSPSSSSTAPVAISDVGHPLLGVTARWELFARGDGVVVRIQFARGRITRTTVPALQSSGPVSFVVGADEAIVRPIDYVPGYVVPDGQPALQMSTRLSTGGPAFPGPDLNHVWVQSGDGEHPTMTLAALDGSGQEGVIPVPAGSSPLDTAADGSGSLLFIGSRGVDDVRRDELHRITTGSLRAVGPAGWLAVECHDQQRCLTVVIDRATNSRRVVGAALSVHAPPGVISPDGTTAAMYRVGPTGTVTLYLLDLATGAGHPVDLAVDQAVNDATIAWSPDSRWLFVVGADGTLQAVDARTRQRRTVTDLGPPLPRLSQLVVRN